MNQHRKASPEELLIAAADGERAAFARLYVATSPQLFALALRIVGERAAAEEVLQDAFISIWRHAVDFRPEKGSAMAWLATIVRNRALDRRRRARPETPMSLVPDAVQAGWADPGPDPQTALLASAEARRLAGCLETLDEGPRSAIRLAYYEGLTHEELAARLSTPLGTIKSWIRRGLLRLKSCLES